MPLRAHGPALRTRYGFIYLKARSLPPVVEIYMQEVRAVEAEICQRECILGRIDG